jgi:hypothetical protein
VATSVLSSSLLLLLLPPLSSWSLRIPIELILH